MNRLVLDAMAGQLLTSDRLPQLLRDVQRHRRAMANGNVHRRTALRRQLKETDRQIRNLLDGLAQGIVGDTALFREAMTAQENKRDETIRLLSMLDADAPPLRHALSKAQAATLAAKLHRGLIEAPAPLQRRYVRGLVANIAVDHRKVVITGPKAAIAAAATTGAIDTGVRTFVREWRTRQDSNL